VFVLLFQVVQAQSGQTLHIAKGKKVTLKANSIHAISYLWFQDGAVMNGYHGERITVQSPGVYTVMALGQDCDSDLSDPVTVVLDATAADVEIDMAIQHQPSKKTVILGEQYTYQLAAVNSSSSTAEKVLVTFNLPNNVNYVGLQPDYQGLVRYLTGQHILEWELDKMTANQTLFLNVEVAANKEGLANSLAQITAKQKDPNLKNNQDQAQVSVLYLFIPNVITPNGDGFNDVFYIDGLEQYKTNRLIIFNRFGQEVYVRRNYTNDWNGQGLNKGTYYYILEVELNGVNNQVFKGYITLM